jgi:hypothetical protein
MIAVLTPAYDSKLNVLYVDSLLNSMRLVPNIAPIFIPGDALLQRARNELLKIAVDGKVDQIVWIDSDMTWNSQDFKKLVDSPKDFISGICRQKKDDGLFCFRNPKESKEQNILEVESVGMGFCKMSKKCYEKIWAKSKKYLQGESSCRNAFEVIIDSKGQLCSEDISACYKWGGKIYVDTTIRVGHIGLKVFI